ncbi:uncharacterized protein fsbp [Brachyhypopomus gauderio]|uniref:uncharacterized protein fsbp n=1 Tax=Brachyhypopomus gauderio TaxID=698409 RepID=UPI0040430900
MALVPNLISNMEDMDGDGSYASVTNSSPGAVAGGTNGNEQEDTDQIDEVDSKELVAIDIGLASPPEPPQNSGTPLGPASSSPPPQFHSATSRASTHRPSVFYPSQSQLGLGLGSRGMLFDPPCRVSAAPHLPPTASTENSLPLLDVRGPEVSWEARRQEVLELEHQQTMSLLLLQQCVWEEKRRAARQKERAARAKKRYYQAKLRRLGAEVPPSSSEESEEGPEQT